MINYDNDLEIFKIVFEVFDPDKKGFISKDDVVAITVSMRKDLNLVLQILETVQNIQNEENHDPELVSFGEFATLIWQVEQKQNEAKE